jgi:hypothetical protein
VRAVAQMWTEKCARLPKCGPKSARAHEIGIHFVGVSATFSRPPNSTKGLWMGVEVEAIASHPIQKQRHKKDTDDILDGSNRGFLLDGRSRGFHGLSSATHPRRKEPRLHYRLKEPRLPWTLFSNSSSTKRTELPWTLFSDSFSTEGTEASWSTITSSIIQQLMTASTEPIGPGDSSGPVVRRDVHSKAWPHGSGVSEQ